jgi:hypothetical protein
MPHPRSVSEPMHLLVVSTGLRLCGPDKSLTGKYGTGSSVGGASVISPPMSTLDGSLQRS